MCLRGAARFLSFALTFGMAVTALLVSGLMPLVASLPLVERIASRAAGGTVAVEGLDWRLDRDAFTIAADRVILDGAQNFEAERPVVVLHLPAVLRGRLRARIVRAEHIRAEASASPTGAPATVPSIERLLTLLASGRAGMVSLPSVTIAYQLGDGTMPFILDGGSLEAAPASGGYAVEALLPFLYSDHTALAELSVLVGDEGTTTLDFRSDGAPLQPLLTIAAVDAVRLDSTLSGTLSLTVDGTGSPVDGAIDLTVVPGTGSLVGTPFDFGENRLKATFAEGTPTFRIETLAYDFAGNRGLMEGLVRVRNILDPAEAIFDFNLVGRMIHLDLGAILEAPIDVEETRAIGIFDAAARRLALRELTTTFFGSAATGSLTLTFPEGFKGSPRLEADAVLPGPLTPQEVLAGWPLVLAAEARTWVVENLPRGRLTNLAYEADIPMNAIEPGRGLPDDSMTFTFDAADATVRYLPDMPPIEKLRARATVRGNSFEVMADSGRVRGVMLDGARLDMPRFTPEGATATFEGRLRGEVARVLAALEEARLVEFRNTAFTPDSFAGRGSFDLRVAWPLVAEPRPDDVRITGEGAFARGAIDDVLPGVDATDAAGRVWLSPDALTISGDGLAASAPAEFLWKQSLRGDMKAQLSVEADFDTTAADMIGLPLRQFFSGEVKTQIFAADLSPGAPLYITGDLKDAAVQIAGLGLFKPHGEEGLFETTLAIPPHVPGSEEPGPIALDAVRLSAQSFNIEGSGLFTPDGGIIRLELPRVFIEGRADLSLRLRTEAGFLDVGIHGEHADAGRIIDQVFSAQGRAGRLPGRSQVDIALDRVSLKNGVELRSVTAEGRHDGRDFEQLTVLADLGGEGRFSMTLDRPQSMALGFVEIESTDFGTLANGVLGISSMTGAAGSIKGTTSREGGFEGRFEMSELVIRDAPILARILSATSLDGLSDLLNGEGIRFTELEGDVQLAEGRIVLSGAKLVGSAVGVSASGIVDLDNGLINVRGAVAPAYAVNSVLGNLPGIGRLFVSRAGEGILAFAYQISGPLDEPTVTVNALSALAPGILRRIFDPAPGDGGDPEALLEAAIEAAREAETAGP